MVKHLDGKKTDLYNLFLLGMLGMGSFGFFDKRSFCFVKDKNTENETIVLKTIVFGRDEI